MDGRLGLTKAFQCSGYPVAAAPRLLFLELRKARNFAIPYHRVKENLNRHREVVWSVFANTFSQQSSPALRSKVTHRRSATISRPVENETKGFQARTHVIAAGYKIANLSHSAWFRQRSRNFSTQAIIAQTIMELYQLCDTTNRRVYVVPNVATYYCSSIMEPRCLSPRGCY